MPLLGGSALRGSYAICCELAVKWEVIVKSCLFIPTLSQKYKFGDCSSKNWLPSLKEYYQPSKTIECATNGEAAERRMTGRVGFDGR
jgi:hypothetical protein